MTFTLAGEGFSPDSRLRRTIEFKVPTLEFSAVPSVVQLAPGLATGMGGVFAGPDTTRITFTSSDPSKLLLSADPANAGQASITVEARPYAPLQFYAIGLAGSGTVNVQLTAEGYQPTEIPVTFYPPAVLFAQPSLTRGLSPTTIEVQVRPQLDSPTSSQYFAATRLIIPIQSSNAALGTLNPTSITMEVGKDRGSTTFTPAAKGITILTLTPPEGFVSTTAQSQMVVIVN